MTDATDPRDALAPGVSASVEASAGSGKTWLLVSRVVRLLLDGAEPGGLVALTFTRKAAAEMRLRLNQRLALLARADDAVLRDELERIGAPTDPATCTRARALYRALLFTPFPPKALTLDAFAQDLLGRFALEAGLEPGFSLVEKEDELNAKVWRRLQLRLREEPDGPAARALTELIRLGHGEFVLREIVNGFLARRNDWRALVEGRADPVDHAAGLLAERLGQPDAGHATALIDNDLFNARLKMLYGLLREAGDVRSVKHERLAPALDLRGAERLDVLRDALYGTSGDPYKFEPKKSLPEALRNALVENHAEVMARVESALEQMRRAETLACSRAAMALGEAALQALDDELDAAHALGFAELEWHAFRLLREADAAEWIRYKLDRRIDHLLLDEFQDTSPTQWRMLLPALEEMAAGDDGRRRSLFLVGDPKQSIYGFRRADPGLLGRAARWMHEHLGAITRPLHDSRRSAPAVIDFVNALFEGDLGARLGYAQHGTHRRQDWGCVEVAPMIEPDAQEDADDTAFRDPLREPRAGREDRRAAEEAAQVCARLRALVDSGVEVRAEHGPPRAIGYGDIMVLARARTHLHALEHQLSAEGIPFVGAARGTLLQTSEALDLFALLRLLEAPHRDLELARVLRSPLFGADDESLAVLALAARAAGNSWREALERMESPAPALARARRLLQQWQPLAGRLPAHDLIDRILCDADAAARYASALPQAMSARARANLNALLQLALEADSGRYPNLSRFLRFLDARAQAERDAPDEAPPPALHGHVRIMTVHAAKGLEAPAVFVVNAGSVNSGRTPRLLIDWPTVAERPLLLAVSGAGDAVTEHLAEALRGREQAEDLNLLYVAMTRARQFLHVSGFRMRNAGRASWHELAEAALLRLTRGARVHAGGTPPPGAPRPLPAAPAADPRLRQPLDIATRTPGPARASGAAGAESAATVRGTALHYLLQRLAEGQRDTGVLAGELRARVGALPQPDIEAWLAQARAVIEAPELQRFFDPRQFRRAWNEVPLTWSGGAATVDRLVDDGETLWVLDYKTHPRPEPEALAREYRAQLEVYAGAVATVWPGRTVRAALVLTATRSLLPVL